MTASASPRAFIRYAVITLAVAVFICWALWEVRDALMLVYISALVAIGLSPVVNATCLTVEVMRQHTQVDYFALCEQNCMDTSHTEIRESNDLPLVIDAEGRTPSLWPQQSSQVL